MQMKLVEQTVINLAADIITNTDIELVDVEFLKEAGQYFLRIYIDKEGGIKIDDCEWFSKQIDPLLGENLTEEPYILEVSSPGLDRPLKKESDFIRYNGRLIDIKLYKAKNGKKKFSGFLKDFKDNIVTISDEETEEILEFQMSEIGGIRLKVVF